MYVVFKFTGKKFPNCHFSFYQPKMSPKYLKFVDNNQIEVSITSRLLQDMEFRNISVQFSDMEALYQLANFQTLVDVKRFEHLDLIRQGQDSCR